MRDRDAKLNIDIDDGYLGLTNPENAEISATETGELPVREVNLNLDTNGRGTIQLEIPLIPELVNLNITN